jgi:hypothetical protein
MIHCDPAVIMQLEKLEQRVRGLPRSLVSQELGFEVERVDGKLKVNGIRMAPLPGNQFRPNWTANTVWVAHSHPSIAGNSERPSPGDMQSAQNRHAVVVTIHVVDDVRTRASLFNGNNPLDNKGKDRVINPLPKCPSKK